MIGDFLQHDPGTNAIAGGSSGCVAGRPRAGQEGGSKGVEKGRGGGGLLGKRAEKAQKLAGKSGRPRAYLECGQPG